MRHLPDFLMARIAEDEADASSVHELACDLVANGLSYPTFGWTCSCGKPARTVAESEAKRRIVQLDVCTACATEAQTCSHQDETHRLMALPYADHPDYVEEWSPE